MALIVKTGKYFFIKNLGVDSSLIDALAKAGIKFALGAVDFSLISSSNKTLYTGSFIAPSVELANGSATSVAKAHAKNELTKGIKQALSGVVIVTPPKLDVHTGAQALGVVSDVTIPSGPVFLGVATALYQPVRGTSPESVYVVVGLSSDAKVAAKIKNNSISIRVEGPNGVLSNKVITAFAAQGLQAKKDKYLSGHFTCENVSTERVLGAVLIASGIKFTTPIPDVSIVKSLSHD